MTSEMTLAPSAEYRGPQRGFLKEGGHFKNPWYYEWPRKVKAIEVEPGKVMVLVRKYDKPIPPEQMVALKDDEKGILPGVMTPGRYYISEWEYDFYFYDIVRAEPGYMGVVTLLVGKEAKNSNKFIMQKGERGTQPFLLPPGTHPDYSNPFVYKVTPMDARSQKVELAGKDSFTSLSRDGVDVNFEVTIEWAPDIKRLPEVFVKFVDEKDLETSGVINNIQEKVVLPYARSFIRTVGGKHNAVDYITGDTKIVVQNDVEKYLRHACANVGILIRGFVIRKAAEILAQITRIKGQAGADVIEATKKAEASGLQMMVEAYGGSGAYNLATFAEGLPDDLKIEYRYSGEGTFWTDAKAGDIALKKILAQPIPKKAKR